ncbi:MAG TPA: hypothetical protein VGX69_09495 [Solirubrobacteraceae bacterium]|jgi:hypothetical protein|nr:hypothetical protein [Solirubrobacteraceae bacterium]
MSTGDFRIGEVQINQFGRHSVGQQIVNASSEFDPLDRLPDDTMSEFIRAVAQSLSALALSRTELDEAQRTLDEIRREAASAQPEHRRLRQLATTLRGVLTEASGHAIGGGLLGVLTGVWHP